MRKSLHETFICGSTSLINHCVEFNLFYSSVRNLFEAKKKKKVDEICLRNKTLYLDK